MIASGRFGRPIRPLRPAQRRPRRRRTFQTAPADGPGRIGPIRTGRRRMSWGDSCQEVELMSRIQVVYASRHGGTKGIALRIGAVLRDAGHEAFIEDASNHPDAGGFDAYVVASGVYMGSWLKEAVEYLDRNQPTLAGRPVWLLSSGPLPGSTKSIDGVDPLELALGPVEGPGSAGHRRIRTLSDAIGPRDHRVFLGAFDPTDSPKSIAERVVRMMPGSSRMLPPGDFRDWPAIEAWARDIAVALEVIPAA
jgi:menaquinone-dependent protoporphyrinogen oxidase